MGAATAKGAGAGRRPGAVTSAGRRPGAVTSGGRSPGAAAGGGRSLGVAAAGSGRSPGAAAGAVAVIVGRWPFACPEASSWMENSKDECPCSSGAGSFDSTGKRSSEATSGAVKGSMFCCKTSLSCCFFLELCLCTKRQQLAYLC